mgnify:CR=1 FL=1
MYYGEIKNCDIANGGGYDINYVLNRRGEYRKVAEIAGAESGVAMEVCTDLPGLQFYSGNMLDTEKYKKRTGFCLETQFLPNAVNCPSYAALGSPVAAFSSFTSCQELNASRKLM